MTVQKSNQGRFFEDFRLNQKLVHSTPRTITEGDVALYIALMGSRFLLHSSSEASKAIGHKGYVVDDLLVFHIAFGKTVQDVSLNAVANLGYADVRFLLPVYVGDTLHVSSTVIGLRENKSGKSGIVYVESIAYNQCEQAVLRWNRWVMVHKKDVSAKQEQYVPELPDCVGLENMSISSELDYSVLNAEQSGGSYTFADYRLGERIDHRVGITIDDSDHTLATKLYQNNARVHFDAINMQNSQFKQRLIYGGHIISLCRSLSFNGLENALNITAIHGGSHCAPTFAGDTIYACSEVLACDEIAGRGDVAVLRLKTYGIKNMPSENIDVFYDEQQKRFHENVVLALDYSVLVLK